MSWVRIDDHFGFHPKIEELSDAAFRLHIRAKCWSAQFDLGGLVTRGALPGLARSKAWEKLVNELKRCVIPRKGPLWEEREDGHFTIHDFDQFNFTSEEAADHAEAVSKARQEAGRRGGKRSAEARRQANGTAQPKQTPEANPRSKPEANGSKGASKQNEANPKQFEAPIPIPSASSEAEGSAAANPEAKRMRPDWRPSGDTLAGLEVQMIPDWAVPRLLGRFVAHFAASGEICDDATWNQRFAKWASLDWNDPKRRPRLEDGAPGNLTAEDFE